MPWLWTESKVTLQDLFCSERQTKEGKTGAIAKKGILSSRMIMILQAVEMQSEKSAATLTSINNTEACSGIKIMRNANSRSLLIPSLFFFNDISILFGLMFLIIQEIIIHKLFPVKPI